MTDISIIDGLSVSIALLLMLFWSDVFRIIQWLIVTVDLFV